MFQSAKDETNKLKEAKLWLDFSADDVVYFIVCGPSDCHHHNRPFDKPAKCLTEKPFSGTRVNGEKYERDSGYRINQFTVLFVNSLFLKCVKRLPNYYRIWSSWKKHYTPRDYANIIKSQTMFSLGITVETIKELNDYWEHVLSHVIVIISTLAERGMRKKIGGIAERELFRTACVHMPVWSILAGYISKCWNSGKSKPSYPFKTTCEQLIELIAQTVHAIIVDEVNSSCYFSLSVDLTSSLPHIDQLSVVLTQLKDYWTIFNISANSKSYWCGNGKSDVGIFTWT